MNTTRLTSPLAQQIYDAVQEVRMSLWTKGLNQQSIAFLPLLLLAYREGLLNGAESANQIAARLISLMQEQKDEQTKDAIQHLRYLSENIDNHIHIDQLIEPFKFLNGDTSLLMESCKEVIEEMFQEPSMLSFGLMADIEVNYAFAIAPKLSPTSTVLVTSTTLFRVAMLLPNCPQILVYDPIVASRALMAIRARIHHAQERIRIIEIPSNYDGKNYDLILTHFTGAKADLTFDNLVSVHNLDEENKYDNLFNSLSASGKILLFTHLNLLSSSNFVRYRSQWINRKLVESVCSFDEIQIGKSKVSHAIVLFSKASSNDKVFLIKGNAFKSKKFGKSDVFDGLIEAANEKKVIPEKAGYVASNSLSNFQSSLLPDVLLLDWYPKYGTSRLNNYLKLITNNSVRSLNYGKVLDSNLWNDDSIGSTVQSSDLEDNQVPDKFRRLSQSAVLVQPRRVRGIAKYFKHSGEDIYLGPGYLVFEVINPEVDPIQLVEIINSEVVMQFIRALRAGSTIPNIRVEDFLRIPIYFSTEANKATGAFENSMDNIVNEPMYPVILSNESPKDENFALLRHTIAGPLSNIQGAVDRIQTILKEHVQDHIPNLFEIKANPNHEMNLGKWLELMRSEVEFVSQIIAQKDAHFDEILNEPLYKMDIAEFLTSYVSQLTTNGQFEARIDIEEPVLLDHDELPRTVYVMATEKLLRTLLDNLVENAVKHAFRGQDNMHIVFCLRLDETENTLSLDVSNTGYPFPPGFDFKTYWRKGGKAGFAGGDGLGGWMVGQIIDKLDLADNDIYDEVNGFDALTDTNLATTFWFSFKLVN